MSVLFGLGNIKHWVRDRRGSVSMKLGLVKLKVSIALILISIGRCSGAGAGAASAPSLIHALVDYFAL